MSPARLLQRVAVERADLSGRLHALHEVARARYPFLSRVALALYDGQTDLLKTFASSNDDGCALQHYETPLRSVPSLQRLLQGQAARVIDDMATSVTAATPHSDWLRARQYRSSYTVPLMHGRELSAFLFFDSKIPAAFTHEVTDELDVFADLISQLLQQRVLSVNTLIGTVRIASRLTRIRDVETGDHLERIAKYARLIGAVLAPDRGLSDEYIEYLHLFAPLHDIGKVGIPDAILLKPGRLDGEEWRVMQTHVAIGVDLVDLIIDNLALQDDLAAEVMRQIVASHHERGDGSGYPAGLRGDAIPLAARIVAVADVYDALSSPRPYKPAWDEVRCFAELRHEAQLGRLDAACLAALQGQATAREQIRIRHADR